jgi:beta-carotene hydroxylase
MLTFTYPVFRSCHLQHHAHTNDPDLDPDLWVANRPGWLRPIWLVGTAVHYRRLYVRHQWGTPAARRAQFALDAVLVLSLPIALVTGYVAEVWVLYWAPTLVAGLFMFYAFDYLPHHPHTSTERYHDTRIQPGRIRHALLLAQNYHLIHHLWVSVPWFRYRTAFTHVEDGLRAKGATIDG